jgi:hypothetical protein
MPAHLLFGSVVGTQRCQESYMPQTRLRKVVSYTSYIFEKVTRFGLGRLAKCEQQHTRTPLGGSIHTSTEEGRHSPLVQCRCMTV